VMNFCCAHAAGPCINPSMAIASTAPRMALMAFLL
jgi:hypothetical protein